MSAQDIAMDRPTSAARERHLPGEPGVWVFIMGDMMVFALFFFAFVYHRALDVELYNASQLALNQNYGALNTLLLLTSSWFVVMGLRRVRAAAMDAAAFFFKLAFACGLGFGAIKIVEYGEKISQGIVLNTNEFFSHYYAFTGIHFLHLVIGMGVLAFMIAKTKKAPETPEDL